METDRDFNRVDKTKQLFDLFFFYTLLSRGACKM
jgi:hypothetical protein